MPKSPPARAPPSYPATPGSALSEPDVAAQLATLLDEREELRRRVEEQKAQIVLLSSLARLCEPQSSLSAPGTGSGGRAS